MATRLFVEVLADRLTPSTRYFPDGSPIVDQVGPPTAWGELPDRVNVSAGSGPVLVVVELDQELAGEGYVVDLVDRVYAALAPFADLVTVTSSAAATRPDVAPWERITARVVERITWRPDQVLGYAFHTVRPLPNLLIEPTLYVERNGDPGDPRLDRTHRTIAHEFGHVAGAGHEADPSSVMHGAQIQMNPEPKWSTAAIATVRGNLLGFAAFYALG